MILIYFFLPERPAQSMPMSGLRSAMNHYIVQMCFLRLHYRTCETNFFLTIHQGILPDLPTRRRALLRKPFSSPGSGTLFPWTPVRPISRRRPEAALFVMGNNVRREAMGTRRPVPLLNQVRSEKQTIASTNTCLIDLVFCHSARFQNPAPE